MGRRSRTLNFDLIIESILWCYAPGHQTIILICVGSQLSCDLVRKRSNACRPAQNCSLSGFFTSTQRNPWQLTLVFLGLNPFKYSDFFSWFKGVAKINLSWWFCCWWCAKLSQYSKPLEYSPLVPLSMAKCLMAPRLAPPHGETLTCFGTLTLGSAGTRPRPVPQYSMTPKDLAMPPLVHRWRGSSCFTLLVACHSQTQAPNLQDF